MKEENSVAGIFEFLIESSSKNLPTIYQRITKNKAIFGILPFKNLPRFTTDLPKVKQAVQLMNIL